VQRRTLQHAAALLDPLSDPELGNAEAPGFEPGMGLRPKPH
jgi:hypothetical protein